jgi:hypothetical protein
MSFLYPAFLIGALAIAIPVVLHFLRRDIAPEIPFSAVRLLRRSPVARSRRRRLRDLLLLATRIAALLLLAAAFARPYKAGASSVSAVRIVAVDRSFSMGAPGRFTRALDLARRAVDDASAGERVAVIAFDDNADVLAPPGLEADAKAALANLQPGFASTKYGALFAKAAEIAGTGSGSLIVITDLQRAGWGEEGRAVLPSSLTLEVRDVGAPVNNVSVVAVRTAADRVIASIHNSGAGPRMGKVRVERDGTTTATVPYTAEPDATVDVPIPYRVPSTGALAVTVDDNEGFAADNTRFVVLDPLSHATVLVVTSGASDSGFYVGRALAATADRQEQRMDAQVLSSASVGREPDAGKVEFGNYSAVVLLSTRALDRRAWESLAAFVRSGGGLVIAASPDVDPIVLSAMFDWRPALDGTAAVAAGRALSPTDLRHPIFRPFGTLSANLGQVQFERTWRLATEGWDLVARFTDGSPALIERREGQGRAVVFASDFDRRWNNFPLHPAFVPFVLETVRYVSAARDRGREYLVGFPPEGAGARPGVYRAAVDGRAVAVNVDTRESIASALSPTEFVAKVERVPAPADGAVDARAQQVEARQSYWRYGLLLMLAALIGESFVGRA